MANNIIGIGDLVEVIPHFGIDWRYDNPNNIRPGMQGVVVSGHIHREGKRLWDQNVGVRFAHCTDMVAVSCLRKISGPPTQEEDETMERIEVLLDRMLELNE